MLCFNISAIRTFDKQAGVISLSWQMVLDVLPPFVALMVMYAIGREGGRSAERKNMQHRTTQQAIINTIFVFKERGRQVSIGDLISVMPKWPHKIYPVVEHMLLTGEIIVTNPLHAENQEPRYFDLPAPEAEDEAPADLVITDNKEV